MYILRIDDACENMDINNWQRIENIVNRYSIKPIVGIIPNCQDSDIVKRYSRNDKFWDLALSWQDNKWIIALHGYDHVYITRCGGLNPVQARSEFAGVSLNIQRSKIHAGIEILKYHRLDAKVFFAPSHTFDRNTLLALKMESDIRIISDTIAYDVYKMKEFYFLPVQSGHFSRLPFRVSTFCYHPNSMNDKDFDIFESFISKHRSSFCNIQLTERRYNVADMTLKSIYFAMRSLRSVVMRI